MKKNLLLIFCILTNIVLAQISVTNKNLYKPTILKDSNFKNNSRAFNEMLVWYGSAENEIYGDNFYSEFIWQLNSNATASDSLIKTVYVTFNQLVDELGDPDSEINYNAVDEILIDTIYIQVGHINNSGTTNNLIASIVSLDNNNRPTTNKLWSDTLSTDTSFTGGASWLNTNFVYFTPNQSFGNQPFAVQVEYEGTEQDTFGIIAGFAYDGPCGITGGQKAIETLYATNSYRLYSHYEQDFGIMPTSQGGEIYYDCNANGQNDPDDSVHYMQNINIATKLTIEHTTNIIEDEIEILDIYPNPAKQNVAINYELKSHSFVNISIFNIKGEEVLNTHYNNKNKGNYTDILNTSKLKNGFYFISIHTNHGVNNKKIMLEN